MSKPKIDTNPEYHTDICTECSYHTCVCDYRKKQTKDANLHKQKPRDTEGEQTGGGLPEQH